MSLYVIATPIGNAEDLSRRAERFLREADVVIGEERRVTSTFLKTLGMTEKPIELLNEHSRDSEVRELMDICRNQKVALISDCGTPGFCDPGAKLVKLCRNEGIEIVPVPGASSLMTLLSVAGLELSHFLFLGFLPREANDRQRALREIQKELRAVVVMDTPYRLVKLLDELSEIDGDRLAVLGMNLTSSEEKIVSGPIRSLKTKLSEAKSEFVLILNEKKR